MPSDQVLASGEIALAHPGLSAGALRLLVGFDAENGQRHLVLADTVIVGVDKTLVDIVKSIVVFGDAVRTRRFVGDFRRCLR